MKEYTLNGTLFSFDDSGFLKGLNWQGHSFMTRGRGLFDLAQPVKYEYEDIRLEPDGALFSWDGETLTVTYERLRPDIDVPALPELAGGVSAKLFLRALPDGQSVSMKLEVCNNAQAKVRQIMFPFFKGLDAIDAEEDTRFTTLGFCYHPFRELNDIPQRRYTSFATNPIISGRTFESGGYMLNDNMIGRYYDYGSLKRGFSLYHRYWGYGPDHPEKMGDEVHIRLLQESRLLWIGGIHYVNLEKGQCYESSEYVFTPHEGGWENGIEPYGEWVNQNKKRVAPPSDKIRDALGFRTIWMRQQYSNDPDSIVWKYEDLQTVGEDMLEHGLKELSMWGGLSIFPINKERFPRELGDFEKSRQALGKVRNMGVNVAPFVNCVSIRSESMERYGLKPGEFGWTQYIKAIPAYRTPYMERNRSVYVDQSNPLWQSDVKEALRFMRDELGTPSIGWDQYIPNAQGGVTEILDEYCRETAECYPEFTLHGESVASFEAEINCLDYTWTWAYPEINVEANFTKFPRDTRAYQRVVGTTRLNINIDNNPLDVKRCFADNALMNIMPSKPNNVNGSALIKEYPEFSTALKQAAKLREKYLEFFREGIPVGDCVLCQEYPGLHVSGYRMPQATLVMLFSPEKEYSWKGNSLPESGQNQEEKYLLEMPTLKDWKLAECLDFDTEETKSVSWKDGMLGVGMKTGGLAIALFISE